MEYNFDQFIWEVTNEAIMLREYATKRERNKLDFDELSVMSVDGCIYGQMTGCCFTERASELIELCCPRYFAQAAVRSYNDVASVVDNVNGTTVDNFKEIRSPYTNSGRMRHYSAIESYITLDGARNANLIAYLRGETEELDLYF